MTIVSIQTLTLQVIERVGALQDNEKVLNIATLAPADTVLGGPVQGNEELPARCSVLARKRIDDGRVDHRFLAQEQARRNITKTRLQKVTK